MAMCSIRKKPVWIGRDPQTSNICIREGDSIITALCAVSVSGYCVFRRSSFQKRNADTSGHQDTARTGAVSCVFRGQDHSGEPGDKSDIV